MRFEKHRWNEKITQKYFLWQKKNAVGGRCFPSAATFYISGRCVTCCAWGGGDYPSKIVGNHRKCPAGAAPSKRYLFFWRFLHAPLGKKDYSELWFDILSEIGNLDRWRGLNQLLLQRPKPSHRVSEKGKSLAEKSMGNAIGVFAFTLIYCRGMQQLMCLNARDGYC